MNEYLEKFADTVAENPLLKQVLVAFQEASNPDKPARLLAEQVKPDTLKSFLEKAGLTFNLSPEDRQNLGKNQFKNMDSGRGVAVSKILGGPEAAREFDEYCDLICSNSRFKFGNDRARGLRQFVADLLEVIVRQDGDPESHAKKVGKLNTRLLYSHGQIKRSQIEEDPQILTDLLTTFNRKEMPDADLATMPIDTPIQILIWLLADKEERKQLSKTARELVSRQQD